jgi:hypothetical protein
MFDILYRDGIKVAFCESKMVNRIQNVGFSYTIIPDKAINLTIELKIDRRKAFIINKTYRIKLHEFFCN